MSWSEGPMETIKAYDEPQRASGVQESINRANSAVEALRKEEHLLAARLQLVLRDGDPATTTESRGLKGSTSELAGQIGTISDGITSVADGLRELIHRLDLP